MRCTLPILALFIFLTTSAFSADNPAVPAGNWVLNLGERTLLILSLSPPTAPGQAISGTFCRPRNFETSDGWSFSRIQGAVVVHPIAASSWKNGSLSLTVTDPDDPNNPDIFVVTLKDPAHAQLRLEGIPMPPFELVRADGAPAIATDWDPAKTYSPDDGVPSNPEMKRIFQEDQQVRQPASGSIGPPSTAPMPTAATPHANCSTRAPCTPPRTTSSLRSYSSTERSQATTCSPTP